MSTPLQSGPIPGYIRGILKQLAARGESSAPATSSCTTTLMAAPRMVPTSPFACRSFSTANADRLFGHDRASSRHRRADAGQLRHRRCGRHLCRRSAIQGDQSLRRGPAQRCRLAHAARQYPRARPGRRRHGGADQGRADRRRPLSRLVKQYGLRPSTSPIEDLMDYSERLMREAIRDAARRRLCGHDAYRRLSRRSRSSAARPADRVTLKVRGDEYHRRSHRHRAAGEGQADQHAARRHGRLRDLADLALDPAR